MKAEARPAGEALLDALESGDVRVAERDGDGRWRVNAWVKEGILALFRSSRVVSFASPLSRLVRLWPFVDKEAFPPRDFTPADLVRLVPGGSAVRRGAHVGRHVVLMPPCYVNVGAFVDDGAMVDSHALVGSCAQIGARVHLSAGAQIGGVLEPPGALPVIVEEDAWVGGQCGVYDGVLIRHGAVLAAGTTLTASTPLYDLVHERELRGDRDRPLEVPAGAVVVPGTRPVSASRAASPWARERGLALACALIVKYRDASTDRATQLEDALR